MAETNWGELLGRIGMGFAVGRQGLPDLLEQWALIDQQRRANLSDPVFQQMLRTQGPEAALKMFPGTPIPPAQLMAKDAAPGGPSLPEPVKQYNLPPTPDQFSQMRLEGAEARFGNNPMFKRSLKLRETKTGKQLDVSSEPREAPWLDPEQVAQNPDAQTHLGTLLTSQQMRLVPGQIDPDGVVHWVLERNPGTEKEIEAAGTARGQAQVKYGPGGLPGGTAGLDEAERIRQEGRASGEAQAKERREQERAVQAQLGTIRTARNQLATFKQLVLGEGSKLRPKAFTGVVDRSIYALGQAGKLMGGDQRLRDIERTKKILRSALAKSMADQKGNLNIYEQEAIEQGTAGVYDTIPSAESNFAVLEDLITAKEDAITAQLGSPQAAPPTGTEQAITLPDGSVTTREAVEAELRRRLAK